jgi:erythromycin esterase-like protein
MKSFSLIILLYSFTIALQAQSNIKNYVQENAVVINAISPDSLNFSDLAPLQAAIGDARVVMLGEWDHGDGASFSAKTRLIKFLHEKMGFDVLAFESDFFALNKGFNEKLSTFRQQPTLLYPFLQKSVYSIWTYCDACQPLFTNYLPATYSTNRPLLVTGFDNQMYLPYTYSQLAHSLDSVLKANELPITKRSNYSTAVYPLLDSLSNIIYWKQDPSVFNHADSQLLEIKKEMQERFQKDDFWLMLIENLLSEIREFRHITRESTKPESFNTRDEQMAKNLYWLCNLKYAGKKIIVWAANAHISKYAGHYDDKKQNEYTSMGTVFTQDLQMEKATYVLEFINYGGTIGRVGSKTFNLGTPRSDDLEAWISKDWKYGFIDFSKLNEMPAAIKEPFYSSAHAYKRLKTDWNKVTNGFFFIRTTYPCTATVKFSDPKK